MSMYVASVAAFQEHSPAQPAASAVRPEAALCDSATSLPLHHALGHLTQDLPRLPAGLEVHLFWSGQ